MTTDADRLLKCKHEITRVLPGDTVTVETGDGKGNSVGAKRVAVDRPGYMISNKWTVIHVSDEELTESRYRLEQQEKKLHPQRREFDEPETDICDAPPLRIYRCGCPKEMEKSYSSVAWWEWEQMRAEALGSEAAKDYYGLDLERRMPIDWPSGWTDDGRCLECKQLLVVIE